jgi:hypothetical protein
MFPVTVFVIPDHQRASFFSHFEVIDIAFVALNQDLKIVSLLHIDNEGITEFKTIEVRYRKFFSHLLERLLVNFIEIA